ncbi:MAG: glycosyltransferase family 4 protein [Patescibacteria group bacterium]
MKVVFATGIFPPDIGGPATSVSMLADAWAACGHQVAVVTYSDVGDDGVARPYDVRRVPRAQAAWRRYWSFLSALWRATAAPGPIFAQDGIASGLPALVVAKLRGRRLVVRVAGDFAWERAQVAYGYADSIEEFQKDMSVPPSIFLLRVLQRLVYRRADRVIAPSAYLAGVAKGWGVPEGRVRVIYNGVRLPKTAEPVEKRPHRVVAAGRLVPWKNFDVLIKAMPRVLAKFPDASLMIVGDGPEETRLRSLAGAPMLKGRINLVGRLKREEVCQAISASGVFVLPSAYEGFSHQLVEAFACGAAVVASRAGGNPELMEDGKNGLVVEPGDAAGLADAIVRFMSDRGFADACAAEAEKDLARFSVETQISETSEEILGDGKMRVLVVSRDPSVADTESSAAGRMRAYAVRVDALEVVAVGRSSVRPRAEHRGFSARVVDGRRGPLSLISLCRETLRAAADSGVKLIVAQDPFEAGFAARYAAFRLGIPYVIEDHGAFFADGRWAAESAMNRVRAALGRRVARSSQGIRAVSARAAEPYRTLAPGVPVETIPVSMRLAERRIEPKSSGPFTALYAGRFSPEKNVMLLLRAFLRLRRAVPDARLLLAGSGPEEETLRRTVAEWTLGEAVRFIPWTEDMASVYAQADVAALGSDREGYGRFPAEAMSYGLPVVMTDVGIAKEVLRNATEGFVVPVGDADLLGEALIKLAQEPHTRMLMSAAARRRSESLPDADEIVARVTGFWKRASGD